MRRSYVCTHSQTLQTPLYRHPHLQKAAPEPEEEEDTDLDVFENAEPEQVVPKEKEWTELPHTDLLGIEDAQSYL